MPKKTAKERIRAIRKALKHWMPRRQQNFLMGRTNDQEIAESECLRLAGLLSDLEEQDRKDMTRIAAWQAERDAGRR